LLKLAIKDELGPYKPMDNINYEDLKSVIKNAVKQRLIKLDIVNIEDLIETLLNQLMKKQSLITMDRV